MAIIIRPCQFTRSFEELCVPSSFRERIDAEGIQRVVPYKCAWADRWQLVREFLGYQEIIGANTIFYQPHQYVGSVAIPIYGIFALSIEVAPLTDKGTVDPTDAHFLTFEHVTLLVTYGVPEAPELVAGNETYVTETLEPSVEFQTMPMTNLIFDDSRAATDLDEGPNRINAMTEWVYTIHRMPFLPPATVSFMGHVNDNDIYSSRLGLWFAWETLLWLNPSFKREITSYGVQAWTATFRMLHKNLGTFINPIGWNVFADVNRINASGEIYYSPLRHTGTSVDILFYPPADFSTLIV